MSERLEGTLWTVAFLAALFAYLCLVSGCASGPQLVTTTPVISLAVTFDASDGGTVTGCMVMVNGVGQDSKPETHGNEVDAEVDATVDTEVSAVP